MTPAISIARLLAAVLAVAACLLALPAASQAGYLTFGSDLSSPANLQESHGADSVFWNTALQNGSSPAVPALGQVTEIRLKGYAAKTATPDPLNEVHFQVLRPQGNGTVKVELSSQPFRVPIDAGPNQVTTYKPINFCAAPGDHIAFNDEGGFDPIFYPNGVPFYVFGRVAGSTTQFYTKDNGTNNGAVFGSTPHQGQELLMQMDMATGKDATPICPRGTIANDDFPGVSINDQEIVVNPEGKHTRVRTTCPAGTRVHCTGPMTIVAAGGKASATKKRKSSCKKKARKHKRGKRSAASSRKRKSRKKKSCKKKVATKLKPGIRLGRNDRFWLDPGLTRDVRVPMTASGLALVKKYRRVKAIVTAAVTDGAGQPATATARVTIRAPKKWK